MSWLAKSQDLKIIENILLKINRKLHPYIYRMYSDHEFYTNMINTDIWQDIALNYVRNIFQSIPRRILQVICLKGHLTKYQVKRFRLFYSGYESRFSFRVIFRKLSLIHIRFEIKTQLVSIYHTKKDDDRRIVELVLKDVKHVLNIYFS